MSVELKNLLITAQDIERSKEIARRVSEELGESINWLDILNIGEKYVDYLIAGRSKNALRVMGVDKFISRPTKINVKGDYVLLKYPNQVTALYRFREDKRREYSELINSAHLVENRNGRWIVSKTIRIEKDMESAKKVISTVGLQQAMALMFGYTVDAVRKYWWRFITFADVHYLEISIPGSGKTTYSMILTRFHQYSYYTEPPSLARLIFDAGTREYGELFFSRGLIFDEFDKYSAKDRSKFKDLYGSLLTGLENGEWVRGVRAAVRLSKYVPVVLFGNMINITIYNDTPINQIKAMLDKLLKVDTDPLLERMTIIVLGVSEDLKIRGNDIGLTMLKPSVARGVAEYIRTSVMDKLNEVKPPAELSIRMSRHYRILEAYRQVVGLDYDTLKIVKEGLKV